MKDNEIEEAIKSYLDEIIKSGSEDNVVIQCYPLIALGQYELSKRQTRRITLITQFVGIVSLLVAGVALYISVQNTSSSSRWEQRQIEYLSMLQTKLDSINSNIRELVTEIKKPPTTPPLPAKKNRSTKQLPL
jgi:hypothetical protein